MMVGRDQARSMVRLVLTGIFGLLVLGAVLMWGQREAEAASMVFNGKNIQWTSSGTAASGGLRYHAIGWKFTVVREKGDNKKTKSVTYYTGGAKAKGYKKSKAITKTTKTEDGVVTNVTRVSAKALEKDVDISLKEGWVSIGVDAVIEIYNGSKSYGVYKTKEAANSAVQSRGFRSDFDHDYKGYFGQHVAIEYFYVRVTADKGIESVSPKTAWMKKGSRVEFKAKVKKGYLAAGWDYVKYAKDGVEMGYEKNLSIKKLNCSWEIRAKTRKIAYQIHFLNKAGGTGTMKPQELEYSEKKALTRNSFQRVGYRFAGWNFREDGKGTGFKDGQQVVNLASKDGKVVNLYAMWKPISYIIRFNGNGATSGSMGDMSALYDQGKKLAVSRFKRKGYIFQDWCTVAPDKGDIYADGGMVLNGCNSQGAVLNLYARWKEVSNAPPVIEAHDRYVAYSQAVSGKITQKFLMEKAKALDEEDGEILPESTGKKYFKIKDYRIMTFISAWNGAVLPVTFEACDSAGNVVSHTINVHIIDTTAYTYDPHSVRMRFIGKKYFGKRERDGGLDYSSVWRSDREKKQILKQVFSG